MLRCRGLNETPRPPIVHAIPKSKAQILNKQMSNIEREIQLRRDQNAPAVGCVDVAIQ
jgi:hypothetical protein